MSIKGLECYDRRLLLDGSQLSFHTSKGDKLIVPGMIFGIRASHDGRKVRCILNDDIQRVFTLTNEDYRYLRDNSITVDEAIEEGYIDKDYNSNI